MSCSKAKVKDMSPEAREKLIEGLLAWGWVETQGSTDWMRIFVMKGVLYVGKVKIYSDHVTVDGKRLTLLKSIDKEIQENYIRWVEEATEKDTKNQKSRELAEQLTAMGYKVETAFSGQDHYRFTIPNEGRDIVIEIEDGKMKSFSKARGREYLSFQTVEEFCIFAHAMVALNALKAQRKE